MRLSDSVVARGDFMNYKEQPIYKDDVLDALATEPLHFGRWISEDGCGACAVGSVLRSVFYNVTESNVSRAMAGSYFTRDTGQMLTWLSIRNSVTWMGLLSCLWESLGEYNYYWGGDLRKKYPTEELRWIAYEWVEEHFPEDVNYWDEADPNLLESFI